MIWFELTIIDLLINFRFIYKKNLKIYFRFIYKFRFIDKDLKPQYIYSDII